MFDIGWSELLVIGVVALIVIGPKDLPVMFAALGRFTAKARSMAREFSRAMEDAAKTSGVSDVAKDLKGMTSPKSLGLDKVQQAVTKFEAWDPMKKSAPTVKAPTPPVTAPAAAPATPAATPATAASSTAASSTAPASTTAASPAAPAAGAAAGATATAAAAPASAAAAPDMAAASEAAANAQPAKPSLPPFDPLNGT